jgi:anti-sigma regulatory factor (Ser/Thr protein kinase)
MNIEPQHAAIREKFYLRERRSIPAARQFARQTLADWGFAERSDDVLVCVSELATNALLHGVPPGRGFLLLLKREYEDRLRVEVHDSGDGHPAMNQQGGQAEAGRGLWLVDALADTWDVGARDPGKIVWCEFTMKG